MAMLSNMNGMSMVCIARPFAPGKFIWYTQVCGWLTGFAARRSASIRCPAHARNAVAAARATCFGV